MLTIKNAGLKGPDFSKLEVTPSDSVADGFVFRIHSTPSVCTAALVLSPETARHLAEALLAKLDGEKGPLLEGSL